MSTRGKPRILLMHYILDPGPAILTEAGEVIPYPPDRPLDEATIPQAAEGCGGIVSQLMDPIGETVLSTPRLHILSNLAGGFDNLHLPPPPPPHAVVDHTPARA